MAVPAAKMSMCSGFPSRARIMTWVSSQSLRFSRGALPWASECKIKARLLMLLEAGSWMRACSESGAVTIYCIIIVVKLRRQCFFSAANIPHCESAVKCSGDYFEESFPKIPQMVVRNATLQRLKCHTSSPTTCVIYLAKVRHFCC